MPRAVLGVYIQTIRRHWLAAFAALAGTIIGTGFSIITPLYYKRLLDLIATDSGGRVAGPLIAILLVILGINVAGWICRRIAQFSFISFESHGMNELAQSGFNNLLTHSYAFFTDNFAGSLVRKVSRLSHAYENILDRFFFTLLPLAVSMSGIIFVLFRRSALLGGLFLGWTVVLVAIQCLLAYYKMGYSIQTAEKDSESTGALSDAISNETSVRMFTGAAYERSRFKAVADELDRFRLRGWRFDEYINTVQGFFALAIEFGLLYAGVILWQRGIITIGDFALIQAYIITAVDQLWGFGNVLRRIYESFADATEMVEILNTPAEIPDRQNASALTVRDGAIEFRNITFGFRNEHAVLEHFSLSIAGHEKVALIGSSGAGKTTVTKLLLRFYDVQGGGIYIDEQNIAEVTQESLREMIALVPQEPVLFHRTLMENIRYGRRDATDAEVIEAAKQAHCHEFISTYPEGFETYVGERGIKLSGGERQRVAIARAILKNAPLLILDEATSSLDSESEMLIQDALARLMQGKTVIAIAHRLSTIMKMDRIIVMEDGKAVIAGSHDELLNHEHNLYKKLWEIQAGGFIAADE